MTKAKIRRGAFSCFGNDINTTTEGQADFYPTPDNTGTQPANSNGLCKSSADSVFAAGDRDALLRTFWADVGSGSIISIQTFDGTDTIFELPAAAFGLTCINFGPEGVLIEGGFRINITGATPPNDWLLTYEVV